MTKLVAWDSMAAKAGTTKSGIPNSSGQLLTFEAVENKILGREALAAVAAALLYASQRKDRAEKARAAAKAPPITPPETD